MQPRPPRPVSFHQGNHTPQFATVRRLMALACHTGRPDSPSADEWLETVGEDERPRSLDPRSSEKDASPTGDARWSRRRFLATTATAVLAGATNAAHRVVRPREGPDGPRVVIVGAGLAGLNAVYLLKRSGLRAKLFEASGRTGGRILSARDLVAPGLDAELGGEFIDSGHKDLRALARRFDLDLLDARSSVERPFRDSYYFRGRHSTDAEVVDAFRPLAARIQADLARVSGDVSYRNDGGARDLDRTSLAQYLQKMGATGWIADLLRVAYVAEYGLDADQQSCLNLLFLIGTDLARGFAIFGESDERFKVRGGNQQIVRALSREVEDQILPEHRLVALRSRGEGFTLTFERPDSSPVDVAADILLLCLPFTTLREVEIRVDLPPHKRRAIQELGYGTSAKLLAGFRERLWRAQGRSGEVFTDEPFQSSWDNSRVQQGEAGGLTLFTGGAAGVALGEGTARSQADRLLPGVERVFPGALARTNGSVARFHWPTHPFTKGGYACYKPGQWTTIAGAEFEPVGNLHFAGEHCSAEFQGFMNGAAETGRLAASAILHKIR